MVLSCDGPVLAGRLARSGRAEVVLAALAPTGVLAFLELVVSLR